MIYTDGEVELTSVWLGAPARFNLTYRPLTSAFALHPGKKAQWAAFLKRSGLRSVPESPEAVIEAIAAFLGPVLDALREQRPLRSVWTPGGPWLTEPDAPVAQLAR